MGSDIFPQIIDDADGLPATAGSESYPSILFFLQNTTLKYEDCPPTRRKRLRKLLKLPEGRLHGRIHQPSKGKAAIRSLNLSVAWKRGGNFVLPELEAESSAQ